MNKVKLKSSGQIYLINTSEPINMGTNVLVESDGVIEVATVICSKKCSLEETKNNEEIKEIVLKRVETEEDGQRGIKLKSQARDYLDEGRAKVLRHGLEMKILDADLSFDEKKLTFYFSANGRIDFRGLVSDMAGDFKKIIRLQQIGARDETRLAGGFGKCGRELCCAKFLINMESISLDMTEAKEGKGAKPNAVTGCCGKLMCCLSFEGDSPTKGKK